MKELRTPEKPSNCYIIIQWRQGWNPVLSTLRNESLMYLMRIYPVEQVFLGFRIKRSNKKEIKGVINMTEILAIHINIKVFKGYIMGEKSVGQFIFHIGTCKSFKTSKKYMSLLIF